MHASSARMAEVGDAQAQLVLTGPPYFPAAVEAVLTSERVGASVLAGADVEALARETLQFAWSLRPVFEECWRILPPGGWMVVQTRDVRLGTRLVPVETTHRELLEAVGFHLYARYFWRPVHTPLARRRVLDALARSHAPLPFDPEVFMAFLKPGPARPGEPTPQDAALLSGDSLRTGAAFTGTRASPISPSALTARTESPPAGSNGTSNEQPVAPAGAVQNGAPLGAATT